MIELHRQNRIRQEDLQLMGDTLAHRGPDGEGFYHDESVGFAHRRLAIIDPKLGHQPFIVDDGSIVLTYNGEVYNFKEIREELEPEFRFTTHSDTEVIALAYQKWGIQCLRKFRGMFAFAIYDKRQQTCYIVRDRIGIKPLYFYQHEGRVAFASEMTALTKLSWVKKELDLTAVSDFLCLQYIPAPKSIFRHIRKLEPAHYLKVNLNRKEITKERYWSLNGSVSQAAESVCLEELGNQLEEIIKKYTRSDVPFGSFLSGGVDSSTVTALMKGVMREPVKTFTIGFTERQYSEMPYASEASQVLGTDHHEEIVTPNLAEGLFHTMTRHFGEPFGDSSAVPTYYVSKVAANQVKMVLSGDGGDELFAGYNSYGEVYGLLSDPLFPTISFLFRSLARVVPPSSIRQRLEVRGETVAERYLQRRQLFSEQEIGRLQPQLEFNHLLVKTGVGNTVTSHQKLDLDYYLPDDVLTKVDRMSMANSLEVRVPLLDHHLVEFAFALPESLKIRSEKVPPPPPRKRIQQKYLLKKYANRYFSQTFLDRKKMGFGIPVAKWCGDPLRPLIESRLLDPKSPMYDFLDYAAASSIVRTFLGGKSAFASRVWNLLGLDFWARDAFGR